LDEYLKLLKGTKCHPVIEVKPPGFEAEILDIVRKNEMTDVTTIIAFSTDVIKEIRRLDPKICVGWLYTTNLQDTGGTAEENADRLAEFLIKRCRELDIALVDLGYGYMLSQKLVRLLHESDIHVWAWTVS
jgi:glycerophosphoryl diester phosphodiesterase